VGQYCTDGKMLILTHVMMVTIILLQHQHAGVADSSDEGADNLNDAADDDDVGNDIGDDADNNDADADNEQMLIMNRCCYY